MMVLLLLAGALWAVILLYKPQNLSLKDHSTKSARERAKEARGTLVLGTLLVATTMATFDPATLKLNPYFGILFGLSRPGFFEGRFYFQVVTSNFLHFDIIHLGANLSAIILLAAYERRVGTSRYCIVFALSALTATVLELFVLSPGTLSLGASAGIAGLGCGYFIDYKKMTRREWITGILVVLFMTILLSINDRARMDKAEYGINWVSHCFGVLAAGIFIRLLPEKDKDASWKKSEEMQRERNRTSI
jgi:membrane associated rhomboid family serine protease